MRHSVNGAFHAAYRTARLGLGGVGALYAQPRRGAPGATRPRPRQ